MSQASYLWETAWTHHEISTLAFPSAGKLSNDLLFLETFSKQQRQHKLWFEKCLKHIIFIKGTFVVILIKPENWKAKERERWTWLSSWLLSRSCLLWWDFRRQPWRIHWRGLGNRTWIWKASYSLLMSIPRSRMRMRARRTQPRRSPRRRLISFPQSATPGRRLH